jgi:glycosyltransferase involved in cell wall biosynthesis
MAPLRELHVAGFMSTPLPCQVPIYGILKERYGVIADLFFLKNVETRSWGCVDQLISYTMFPQVRIGSLRLSFPPLRLVAGIVRKKYDAMIIGGWEGPYHVLLHVLCHWSRIPVIVCGDLRSGQGGCGTRPRPRFRSWYRTKILQRILTWAKSALASGCLAAEHFRELGFRGFVSIGFFGVDCQRHALGKRESDEDCLNLLYVGRLVPPKRVGDLVRAVSMLRSRLVPVRLVIAGDGPKREAIEHMVQREHLGSSVDMKGPVPHAEIPSLMRESDALVLPSEREAWGVVVAEAAAAGLVLVVSDAVGAMHDLVRPGENGYVFPAGDVSALAQNLQTLWEEKKKGRLEAMGRISREMGERFSFEHCVDAYSRAIRNAIERKGDRSGTLA